MARAKKCEVEFNPWPPFVDVFSSVILVLLLFILVTIVNVAYYMQYNAKSDSLAQKSSAKVDSLNKGEDIQDMISLAKVQKVAADAKGSDSLFTGGMSEGNAISAAISKEKLKKQSVTSAKNGELLVSYHDKEIFVNKEVKAKIKAFIQKEKRKNKHARFEISVAQPTKILGTTIPKQISLGRALNVKNMIKKMDIKLSDMRLKMTKTSDKDYGFGYVKIKVIK
jgi:hypothetical protein